MRRHDRTDFYRSNRDYASLLDGEGISDKEEDEDEDEDDLRPQSSGRRSTKEEDSVSRERQEYFQRRQKLKELERQKLKRKILSDSKRNGRSTGHDRVIADSRSNHAHEKKRPLPYDNYGSFFGPSEPVVARRIIEDARAREEAELVAARVSREVQEHGIVREPSGVSRSASDFRPSEKVQPAKTVDEAALKLKRLKEARDYSFLFTDEDPTTPAQETHPANSRKPDKERPKQVVSQVKKVAFTAKKGATPSKPSSAPSKPSSSMKDTKTNQPRPHISSKAPSAQERQLHSSNKLSKPAISTPVSKPKLSSEMRSRPNKVISGPGRPSQAGGAYVPAAGGTNGNKNAAPSSHVKKAVTTGSTLNGIKPKKIEQPLAPRSGASTTGKSALATAPHKSVPMSNTERKSLAGHAERMRPVSAGHSDQRRPMQSAGPSKQVTKAPTKSGDMRRDYKRPREPESEDSFLDDDEEAGGDVSSMIRKMFGYNPNKYRDLDDEDDRNMEADFRTIQMEERRSARIAREEDEREQALIEEEERAERARKEAKRRKLKQR